MTSLRGPLSPTQRDVYLDQQRHPELPTYSTIGFSIHLGPELHSDRWEEAVRTVFASEPILQTRLEESAIGLFQTVDPEARLPIGFVDDLPGDAGTRRARIDRLLRDPQSTHASFQHWLMRTTAGEYHAALRAPHLFFDGHSARLFFERVGRCYEALGAEKASATETAPSFYSYLEEAPSTDDPEVCELWRQRLRGAVPLQFRTRREVPGAFECEHLQLDRAASDAVTEFCRQRGYGVSLFFLALYAILLQRYREPAGDWILHAIRGSRPRRFTDTMGCFFRVVPYRLEEERLRCAARLRDLFGYLRDYRRAPRMREEISMLKLQECLPAGGCRAVYNFYDFDRVRVLGSERALEVYFSHPSSEVHLVVGSRDARIELRHLFHTNHVQGRTVVERLRRLAAGVVAGAERVGDLDWLVDDELPRAIGTGRPQRRVQSEAPLQGLFEEQAARQPQAVALVDGERRWSYADLDAFANRLARRLTRQGVGVGALVALRVGRSCEQVAAILAVLKCGGAYVPIDPDYPEARARFVLEDSGAKLLVTDCDASDLAPSDATILRLDDVATTLQREDGSSLGHRAAPEDLAYVIYTSGSTGRPKGVMVTHHNVRRLFAVTRDVFQFASTDVWPLLHSYAFDFSVWEMWGALAFGGRLVVVPSCVARSAEAVRDLVARERVTILNQTPSAFYRFAEVEPETAGDELRSLRWIIFGGEALDVARLRAWFERHGDARPALCNMYGITETTVHATWRRLRRDDAEPGAPSVIGSPLPDLRIYLTDGEGRLVPRGVSGEAWVAGEGVARGYLRRDDLTAERFADDPFAAGARQRLYRSGDVARELPGGDLEYLGRVDHQVQIRGYRVELGEVEAVLRQHPGVADAAVLLRGDVDGGAALTAYVVKKVGRAVRESTLREFLQARLPSYMLCSRFCFLDAMPLTPHGKLDRASLPAPDPRRPELAVRYVAPRSQTEELLVEVFRRVTGLERVGIHDDFFALGGNSLSATQVVAYVRRDFGLRVPLGALFESPTVAGLAEAISASRFADDGDAPAPIARVERGGDPPLTFAQERVWVIQQLHPESVAYHFEAALRFRGPLRVDLLERCLAELVDRHEVLRTTFPVVDGHPVQKVHRVGEVALERRSVDHLPAEEARRHMESWRRETARQPFALDRLPLIRWTLFRLSAEAHVLLHREHHLLHDGWSFVVFVGELLRLYRARLAGEPSPLAPLAIRLGDFAHAEREWMRSPTAQRQLAYWRRQLAGCPRVDLPHDFVRPSRDTYRGESFRFELPADLVSGLRALARENGVTLFVAMLTVFAALLARTCSEREFSIGSGVANRRRPETEGILGMVLNNVILRLKLAEQASLESVLRHVQRVVLDSLVHGDVPFDRVARLACTEPGVGASSLCRVFFSSYEGPMPHVPIPGLTVEIEAGLPNGSAKFDLNVIVVAQPEVGVAPPSGNATTERVTVIWEYSTDLFEPATMERMARHYQTLLRSSVADPKRPWRDLELGSESAALALGRGPQTLYPREASIVELWEMQVARAPRSLAVRDAEGAWTYQQLDRVADWIAEELRRRDVRHGEVVGFCMPRGRPAIASMLGILKAGAAYLPLDPRQPKRRIAWLAADACARFALADAASRPQLDDCLGLERLSFEELTAEPARPHAGDRRVPATADSLAYVMFTSGSTGAPKGVEIRHRGVVRLLFGAEFVRLGDGVRILQLAPLSFDASTFEIWGALLHGGTLVVHPDDVPDVDGLARAIAEAGINTMWLNASLFNLVVDQQAAALAPLEQLLIGGEQLSIEHVRRAYRVLPRTRIINGYGPTENTTFSCCHAIPRELPASAGSVPVGRPIAHSSAYVLDEQMRPLPWGAIGEIYLGGDGVARGYRSRPDLTARSFLPDPFSSVPGATLYRSGDFGRFRTDGTLEFRGRRDDQVKIRGFRVEPAEVEWALHRLPGVRQSAVVVEKKGSVASALVAYVVLEHGVAFDPDRLRREARLELPPHLIPRDFVAVEALPLSHHGKVDRASLPPLSRQAPATSRVAPRTACEQIVVGVIADVLNVEELGVDDEFFEAGGHSLLGLEVAARLSRVFGVEIPVRSLIENPTASALAALIQGAHPERARRSLVSIKPHGAKPPLFFTPGGDGAEGALLVYARVARFLDIEQPFYGLKACGINDDADPHGSVEEMAAAYLAEVKQIQPQGPYFFAGECVGGVIAYEMARQALAAGEEMGLLLLLDSRPPRYVTRARHWLRFFSSRARRRLDRVLGPLPSNGARPLHPGAEELKVQLRCWLDERLPYDAKEAPPTIELAWVNYQRTLLRYRPREYGGRMALVLSEQYASRGVGKEWKRLVSGGVAVHRAPGDHDSYIRQHARATAAIVDTCLAEARARSSGSVGSSGVASSAI